MGRINSKNLMLFFSCLPCFVMAQVDPTMIELWFEESLEDGIITITANFLSEAEDLTVLEYDFEAIREKNNLSESLHKEKGEFLAAQNLAIPLTTTTINLEKSDTLKFLVRIFQVDQFITAKKYSWTSPIKNTEPSIVAAVEVQAATPTKEFIPPAGKTAKVRDISNYRGDALEIQGLIIDETRSKLGRDFYEIFFRKWIPPRNVGDDFIITIRELPSFGRSARIILKVNDQPLNTRALSPRYDIIELQANAGIREVRSYLSNRLKLSQDLENEDIKGSGIY